MSRPEFDENVDYYFALGLKPSATADEIKAGYMSLALIHHPDVADEANLNAKETFHNISEAYKILTKPDVRRSYDLARAKLLKSQLHNERGPGSSARQGQNKYEDFYAKLNNLEASQPRKNYHVDSPEMTALYGVQREKYSGLLKTLNTGSDWTQLQEKYKNEKWNRLPLETRKASRTLPISSVPYGKYASYALFAAGIAYGMYAVKKRAMENL